MLCKIVPLRRKKKDGLVPVYLSVYELTPSMATLTGLASGSIILASEFMEWSMDSERMSDQQPGSSKWNRSIVPVSPSERQSWWEEQILALKLFIIHGEISCRKVDSSLGESTCSTWKGNLFIG